MHVPAVEIPAMAITTFLGEATGLDKGNEDVIAPSDGKQRHDDSGMDAE